MAGKELVERADVLEQQKSEVQKKLGANAGLLRRLEARQLRAKEKLCAILQCDAKQSTPRPETKSEIESVASARAELDLILSDLTEKNQIEIEYKRDLLSLNERSRPLEELLRKWHDRARLVCDAAYLKFLCPVDNPKAGSDAQPELRQQLNTARQALERASEETRKPNTETSAQASTLERLINSFAVPSAVKRKQSEVERLEQEIAAKEADRFRSIVVEVRIIVANIGAYLIAMVMGLLGALTFILRTLSQQLRDHTYVPTSASVSIVRICLGAIAGVFGTLLIPNSDTSIRTLPPLFIPFVFGYGIEILFSLLDKLVRSFTQAPIDAKPSGS